MDKWKKIALFSSLLFSSLLLSILQYSRHLSPKGIRETFSKRNNTKKNIFNKFVCIVSLLTSAAYTTDY